MKNYGEMIKMIYDMFFDVYLAGVRKDPDAFSAARANRDLITDAVGELYAELQYESYNREQIEVELKKAQHEIEGLKRDYDDMREVKDKLLLYIHDNHYEDITSEPTDDIPDDAMMFSEQDLPFPDVEEMAPADELMGGDE